MKKTTTHIFIVDDDAVLLKSLEIEFLSYSEYKIRTFVTGEKCIENLGDLPDIIVLDYHLDGIDPAAMNGIQTLDRIHKYNPAIPVIMLSSQDKIEVAINCMHYNASDYIVKSETAFLRLEKRIRAILHNKAMENKLKWYMERM
ncbi:MAG: response regulator receiver protein [Bacteroidetes bacterium]|jgi:DNA-binding NtrC family response regulator|nr:response regulator receiver protein [Bacteroidota bacterium]